MAVQFRGIERTEPFVHDYNQLPRKIQERVDRAIQRLFTDFRHPSLRVKKLQGTSQIWEARVTDVYRMTFEIAEGGILRLRRVGTHDVLKTPLRRPRRPLQRLEHLMSVSALAGAG